MHPVCLPHRYVPVFGAHQFNPEGIQQHNSTTGGPPSPFEEQVEAMGQLIKQGKVRASTGGGCSGPVRVPWGTFALLLLLATCIRRPCMAIGAPAWEGMIAQLSWCTDRCPAIPSCMQIRAWGLSNETSFGVFSHCAAADKLGVPRPITVQVSWGGGLRIRKPWGSPSCPEIGALL